MDQSEFVNKYIDCITEALAYELKEKLLYKTQLTASHTQIEKLNIQVKELQDQLASFGSEDPKPKPAAKRSTKTQEGF